jgi:acyl carrier protein
MDGNGQDSARIIERARAYVLENFLYARTDVQLTDTDALLERGIIDSMGVLELISFVEGQFGIKVSDDEITEQNFGTLASIANYVLGKRAGVAA